MTPRQNERLPNLQTQMTGIRRVKKGMCHVRD
jgi:hypothetical protein